MKEDFSDKRQVFSENNSVNQKIVSERLKRWRMNKEAATQIYADFTNSYARAAGFTNNFWKINEQKVISWLMTQPEKWRAYKKLIKFYAKNPQLFVDLEDPKVIRALFTEYILRHTETPASKTSKETLEILTNYYDKKTWKKVSKILDKSCGT